MAKFGGASSDFLEPQLAIFGVIFLLFWGPNELFLGSTHVVEQILFSIVSSILIFDFGLILGSF